MKLPVIILFTIFSLSLHAITYPSITKERATTPSNVYGFKNQMMSVDISGPQYNEIIVKKKYSVPNNASLRAGSQTSGELRDLDFCTNGTTDLKIYIPPNVRYFKVALAFRPNNKSFYYSTFRPNGTIDEANALDIIGQGATGFYNDFWGGKTVLQHIRNTSAIIMDTATKNKYNIDTSRGGYLYLSLTQSSGFYIGAEPYDNRYVIDVTYYLSFDKPMTQAQKDHIINDLIAVGQSEPIEDAQTRISSGCSNYGQSVSIITEVGDARTPQQICEDRDDGSAWIGNRCVSAAEQSCTAITGNTWSGSRCVSAVETSCIDDPLTSWIANECLVLDKNITGVANANNGILLEPYLTNGYGWISKISLHNTNATENATVDLQVGNTNLATIESGLTVPSGDVWNAVISTKNGASQIEYNTFDTDGVQSNNVTKACDSAGSVALYLSSLKPSIDDLNATMRVYRYVGTSTSSASPQELQCTNAGGVWSKPNQTCYGLSSSLSSSSSSRVSSSSSSMSSQERACVNSGGTWSKPNQTCYGGTVTSSSSSRVSSSSSSMSSQERACINSGGTWSKPNQTCYGGTVTSSSSSRVSSSSSSMSTQERACINSGGTWSKPNQTCYRSSSSSSVYVQVQQILIAKSGGYDIKGYFVKFGTTNLDYVYITSDLKYVAKLDGFADDSLQWRLLDMGEIGDVTIDPNTKRVSFSKATNSSSDWVIRKFSRTQYVQGYFIRYSDDEQYSWVHIASSNHSQVSKLEGMQNGMLQLSNLCTITQANVDITNSRVTFVGGGADSCAVSSSSSSSSTSSSTSSSSSSTSSTTSSTSSTSYSSIPAGSQFPAARR